MVGARTVSEFCRLRKHSKAFRCSDFSSLFDRKAWFQVKSCSNARGIQIFTAVYRSSGIIDFKGNPRIGSDR